MFESLLNTITELDFWVFYGVLLLLVILSSLIFIFVTVILIDEFNYKPWSTSLTSVVVYFFITLPFIHIFIVDIWGFYPPIFNKEEFIQDIKKEKLIEENNKRRTNEDTDLYKKYKEFLD